MTITLEATFESGAFHPVRPVELPEGASVRLTVEPAAPPVVAESDSLAATEPDSEANADDPLEAVIGICTTGPRDGAQHHDKYIYGRESP